MKTLLSDQVKCGAERVKSQFILRQHLSIISKCFVDQLDAISKNTFWVARLSLAGVRPLGQLLRVFDSAVHQTAPTDRSTSGWKGKTIMLEHSFNSK